MSYEVFLSGRDDNTPLGARADVVALLERLPGWRWRDAETAELAWPDYGGATEVVHVDPGDPMGSVMFSRASELSREAAVALAAENGWLAADPDGILDTGYAQPLDELLWSQGVPPFRHVGEPGWDERARRWYAIELVGEPQAWDAARIDELGVRAGAPVPEELRLWLSVLGAHGLGDVTVAGPGRIAVSYGQVDCGDQRVHREDGSAQSLDDYLVGTALREF